MRKTTIAAILVLVMAAAAWAADVTVINEKAKFPEGPQWVDGKLYYTEYGGHTVMTWNGEENAVFWKQDGCGPSAVVQTSRGDFLVTCYDSGTIARVSAAGETIANYDKAKDGQPFVGPNDFAADKQGGVYFTASGPWDSAPIVGKIFYIDASGTIRQAADDLHYANGLALSPDGKILYCAESEAARVIQFDVGEKGALSNRRLFVRVGAVDPESGMQAYPDGLKTDDAGNLYIGQFSKGRIVVVNPQGEFIKAVDVPSATAPNLAFGPGEETIYVMAVDETGEAPYWGKVYKVEMD